MTPLSIDPEYQISCLRAGRFLNLLDLPDGADDGEIRRQIRRRIARLQSQFAAEQDVLDDLKVLQDWLPSRLREYEEWVQPCLDYIFAYLGGHNADSIVGPAVEEGGFRFRDFQGRFAKATQADPCALLPRATCDEGGDIDELSTRVAQMITDHRDFMYADGEVPSMSADLKQARVDALELVDCCPDELDCHRQLGRALLVFGEFANARVCFQRQHKYTPQDGWVRHSIAWCQMKQGLLDVALTNAEAALALLPRRPDVHHDYAVVLLLCHRIEDALVVTSRALRRFKRPGLPLRYLHALLLSRAGESEQATAAWLDYMRHARGRPGHHKAINRALVALTALGCQVSAERHPLRTIAESAIETLAAEVPEDLLVPRLEEPSGVIDVLKEFRSLPDDLLRAVGVGHGAFGQERLRAVGQSEVAKPRGGATGTSQLRRRLHVVDAEIEELQKESHDAPDTLRNWGKVESQLLQADLAARRIQDSLTKMGTLSSRGWLWQLTGRSGQLREIRRTITQLEQELTVVPGCPPAPHFSNNDAVDLLLVECELPVWLKSVRGRIQSGLNHCVQEIEWWQTVCSGTRLRLESLAAERAQAEEEYKNELARQESRRSGRIARLKALEQQTPSLGFFRAKRCISVAAILGTVCAIGESEELIRCWTVDGVEADPIASEGRVLAASPDGGFWAAGDRTGQIELWAAPMQPRLRRTVAQSPIHSLAFGAGWLFAGLDHSVTVYATPGLQEVAVLGGIEGRVIGIACDADRRRLYVLASHMSQPLYSALYVWEMPRAGGHFRLCRRLYGFGGRATCLAIDPNGSWIAAGEALGSLHDQEPSKILVWEASTLRLKNVLTFHEGAVGAMVFSTDGRYLITGDCPPSIRTGDESPLFIYDMQAGQLALRVNAHRGGIRSFAIDRTGNFLVSGGVDGVWVWSIKRLTSHILRDSDQTVLDFGPDVA